MVLSAIPEDAFQIARARKYTKEAGLEGKVSFVKGDFMRLEEQFGKNYFDAGRSTPFPSALSKLIFSASSLRHRSHRPRPQL